jgi:hypothetical protein
MAKHEKRVLLLGLMPGLIKSEVEEVREFMQERFPDFEVRVVVGMLSAYTFTTEVEDDPVDERPRGAYL